MKIPANGFTHAGKFHADDVFATALLQILRPDIKITRGFVVPDDFDGIVYDIGFGMFDHHQEPRETRPNGIPYAAFGLLWRVLGPGLVGERQARLIDENFIQPLDLNDNTGEQNSLCDAIGFFNPVWDSKEDQDACFFKAVAVAKQILENQIESANAVNRADEKVQQAYKNSRDGIVVLPCYLPWKNGLYKTDALFVIYPSQRGGWSAQCVTDHKTKKPKLPFPPSWAGQPQEVIEQKSGIEGISFCHASRFLITAKDKETALAACRQVLKHIGRIGEAGKDSLRLHGALRGRPALYRLDERPGSPPQGPPERQRRKVYPHPYRAGLCLPGSVCGQVRRPPAGDCPQKADEGPERGPLRRVDG